MPGSVPAARRGARAGDDVRPGRAGRAAAGHQRRACRAAGLDRPVAAELGGEDDAMTTTTIAEPSPAAPAHEQSRARYPDEEGYVERDGVRVFWERYGDGDPTVLLLPTWTLVHSRVWKAQIAYLER